jgi:hypothetical protein
VVPWRLDTESIEPSTLLSNQVRSLEQSDSARLHDTPRQAALEAFQGVLTFDSAGLRATEIEPQPAALAGGLVVLQVLGSDGRVLTDLRARDRAMLDSVTIQAWSISLPSRDLYVVDIDAIPTAVSWPSATVSIACIALTASTTAGTSVLSRMQVRLQAGPK